MDDVGYRTAAAVFLLFSCDFASADLPYHQFEYATESHCVHIISENFRWMSPHIVECPNTLQALSGFGFSNGECAAGFHRTEAYCTNVRTSWDLLPVGQRCYVAETGCQRSDIGVEAFLEHDVSCGPQEVMKSWRILTCEGSVEQIVIRYECCVMGSHWGARTDYQTSCVKSRSYTPAFDTWSYEYYSVLDSLAVKCPEEGQFLQSFQVAHDPTCPLAGDRSSPYLYGYELGVHIKYTCVAAFTGTQVAWATEGCRYIVSGTINSLTSLRSVDCPAWYKTLNGFNLGKHDCLDIPNGLPHLRYETHCITLPPTWLAGPRTCTVEHTGCNVGYFNSLIYMDRHAVDCGPNRSMKWWKVIDCIQFHYGLDYFCIEYECCEHGDVQLVSTPYNSNCVAETPYAENMQHLPVKCPDGHLLQMFNMVRGTYAGCRVGEVRMRFQCLGPADTLPIYDPATVQCLPKADRKSLEAVTGLGRVGCNSGGNTMNGFALDQRAVELCPNSDYLTFNALCTNPTQRAPYSCYTKYTPACLQYSTAGLQALVDHPLQCSDYEAIENWQWFQCSEGNLYVRYQCCHITWLSPTITPYSTGCRNMNAGTMDEFKQHPVACPGADHLQSWKLVACMTRPNFYRIDYTCLAAEPT